MSRELEFKHTNVFRRNLEALESGKRFIINEGGTRSSKTYSILQLLIFICLSKPGTSISIIRKSFPVLRGSILRDFLDIMRELDIYNDDNHNKSNNIYTFNNSSTIEFFSIDLATKVRGRKRDICYINEANELNLDDFTQLSIRTSQTIILDYNPSESESWLYEMVKDERAILIKSTYKDNTFLSDSIIEEIENLINVDENYYKIYCLGEKPTSTSRIYTHFKQYVDAVPCEDFCYGLDFGYNHSMAMVKTSFKGTSVYVEELLYKTKLTTTDLIYEMNQLNLDKRRQIYCDSARPDIIEELKRNGFQARMSDKNVKKGIDTIKSMSIYIHYEATNIMREFRLYSWKLNGDFITDEPVKLWDDGLDALRYAVHTHKGKSHDITKLRFY